MEQRTEVLEHDPRPPQSGKPAGSGAYRLRQGDYRIVYDVDDESLEVTVTRIAHRRDVYRDLGYSVHRRLGFEKLCRLGIYKWQQAR